jgi:hypothetical protein
MKVQFSLIDQDRGTFQIAQVPCELHRGDHRRCADGKLREVAVEIARVVFWVPVLLLVNDEGLDLEAEIAREQKRAEGLGLRSALKPVDTCNTRCRECPCLDSCNTKPL